MATNTDARGAIINFEIDRGEKLKLEPEILDSADAAVDITGHTVELIIQEQPGGTVILSTTNTVHDDPTNGKTQFILTHTTTMKASSTSPTTWYWAIHWKDDSTPALEDIHSSGTIKVHAVPVGAIT